MTRLSWYDAGLGESWDKGRSPNSWWLFLTGLNRVKFSAYIYLVPMLLLVHSWSYLKLWAGLRLPEGVSALLSVIFIPFVKLCLFSETMSKKSQFFRHGPYILILWRSVAQLEIPVFFSVGCYWNVRDSRGSVLPRKLLNVCRMANVEGTLATRKVTSTKGRSVTLFSWDRR